MASKRTRKEGGSSSEGPPHKRSTVRNHDIEFKDVEQRNRYKTLISKPISACRYPVNDAMMRLGIRDNVVRLLNTLGWVEVLIPMRGFENFTYKFLSSLSFTKDRSRSDNPNHRVSFRLLNVDYEMSLENFCLEMNFANVGYIHDSWDHNLRSNDYDPTAFWDRIVGVGCNTPFSRLKNFFK